MASQQQKCDQLEVPEPGGDGATESRKKPYTAPRLTCLGRLDEGDPRRIAFDDLGR